MIDAIVFENDPAPMNSMKSRKVFLSSDLVARDPCVASHDFTASYITKCITVSLMPT